MVSNTQQTEKIRARRHKAMGSRRKRINRQAGMPPFPIHPEGYDPNAADAKPASPAKAAPKAGTDK
jgi:hypothetical protein